MTHNRGFDMTNLLHDIVSSEERVKKWQDVEQLVVGLCKKQDPRAVHNVDTDPDVSLSVGIGIEVKSTTSMSRGLNLNSAAPRPSTWFVVVYYRGGRVKNVAIVSGVHFQCPELAEIKKIDTRLQTLSNPYLRYRTRVMYQMRSPFDIWGNGNFIVDAQGAVIRY